MSIQGFLGNASKADASEFLSEWAGLIAKDETVVSAYKLIRDWIAITDKRLIYIDVKGMTGTKKSVASVPWRHIVSFSIVTAGIMDLNAELNLFIASSPFALTWTFSRSVNIYEVQAVIADAIAMFGGAGGVVVESKQPEEEKTAPPKQTLADLVL